MAEKLQVRIGANIRSYQSSMRRVGDIAKRTAKRMTLAFAAAATAISLVGQNFEQAITETALIADAAGINFEKLERKAREIGKTTAFTATEAAKGMKFLAQAGLETSEIIGSVDDAMKLAGATGADMSQSTILLASTMKQFGLDSSHSQRIVDTFSAAIDSSLLSMDKIQEAMKFAGTTGAALGFTLEETTAAIAALADLGLEGSMAGTNFRMSMIMLAKQTPKTTKAIKELGLTFEDLNPETNKFADIIRAVGEASINTQQAVAIFGARAGLNMKKLADQVASGKVDFEKFTQALIDSQAEAGRTAEKYAVMMATFRGQWKILWSAIQELGISVFKVYADQGKRVFSFLARLVNQFANIINDIRFDLTDFMLKTQLVVVKSFDTMIGVVGQFAGVWAWMWGTLKDTFGPDWAQDLIIEPLKQSIDFLNTSFKVAWDFWFGENGKIKTDLTGILETTGGENAQKALEESQKIFAAIVGNNADVIAGIEKQITENRKKEIEQRRIDAQLAAEKEGETKKTGVKQTEDSITKIQKVSSFTRLKQSEQLAGNIATTFDLLNEATGGSSKELFKIHKTAAIAQATINAYLAITDVLANVKGPLKIPLASSIGALAFAQVAAIASQAPPSFDQGGISTTPGIFHAAVPEAHIPLKGGRVPVRIEEPKQKQQAPVFIMQNPVFQDLETQRQTMVQIARFITKQEAPVAFADNFIDDGITRTLTRGRL